jgi:glycosyltransferase involved in cell wall biosynthesis
MVNDDDGMKILVLTPAFYPEVGGGEGYVYHLSEELAKRNDEVIVIAPAKTLRGIRRLDGNITVYYCNYVQVLGTEIISPYAIYKILKRVKPQIIHGHGPSVIQDIGFLASRLFGIPMVATYHGDKNWEKLIPNLYMRVSTWLALKRLDKIIVTSRRFFDILRNRGIAKEKLVVIPVGIDIARFASVHDNNGGRNVVVPRKKLGLEGDAKIVLFVGRLDKSHYYKRLDLLLSAFVQVKEKIKNSRLMVVGQGDLLRQHQRTAELLHIQNCTSFHTDVGDDKLPDYYASADVFVLPSPTEMEGFGIVILEAMAVGTPVIASDRCGGAFTIKESGSGLLYRAPDVDDLADKIIKILADDSVACNFGKKGAEYAKRFDWAAIAENIRQVYLDCLEERSERKMHVSL